MENIKVISKYGLLEFFKSDKPMYRLSKNKNSDYYSILDYKRGIIKFFVAGWDRQKLMKEYIKILSK